MFNFQIYRKILENNIINPKGDNKILKKRNTNQVAKYRNVKDGRIKTKYIHSYIHYKWKVNILKLSDKS